MKVEVHALIGEVADNPEQALSALADIAEADGACRDDWLAKASTSLVKVETDTGYHKKPVYQPVADAVKAAGDLHDRVMVSLRSAIRERLEQAAREADTSQYTELIEE